MSAFFENIDRKVIPNFRSLRRTVQLGELDTNRIKIEEFTKGDLQEYISDFEQNRSLAFAGDLVSAAIVNNILDDPSVIDAAKFIFKNESISTVSQIELAAKILKIKIPTEPKNKINKIEEFIELNDSDVIHENIRSLKQQILRFGGNPFLYTELARLYTIIGQKESAKKNILIAKYIAPNNRYILRSFARLMAHFNDIEQAHNALRKNVITKFDPWLLASEIAFASLRNKHSNLIKNGNELINSKKFKAFSLSELASSLGTVELLHGSRKKSLSLFQTALICPNDNSLAQVEWANNKGDLFDLDINKYAIQNSSEAITLGNYYNEDWAKAIENAEKWFIDMPFAKRPIMFGSHAAGFYLEDYETAIKFCKAGLISNPNDPQLINNIAYSYALNNDPTNAFHYLDKIDINSVKEDHNKICLMATKGLAYYKMKLPEKGRELYLLALLEAKQKNFKHYYDMALMHFTREEILLGEEGDELFEQVKNISDEKDPAVSIMKKRVINLKQKKLANPSNTFRLGS